MPPGPPAPCLGRLACPAAGRFMPIHRPLTRDLIRTSPLLALNPPPRAVAGPDAASRSTRETLRGCHGLARAGVGTESIAACAVSGARASTPCCSLTPVRSTAYVPRRLRLRTLPCRRRELSRPDRRAGGCVKCQEPARAAKSQ